MERIKNEEKKKTNHTNEDDFSCYNGLEQSRIMEADPVSLL